MSGYGVGKDWPDKATGDLGTIKIAGHGYGHAASGEIDVEAGADLSGTWSLIGRSMVLSHGDERLGCCTIGLAAAPKKRVSHYGHQAPVLKAAAPAYQPYGGYGQQAGYGGASYGGASYGGASYGGASYGGASYGGASYGGYGGASYGGASYGGVGYGSYGGAGYGN